MMDGAQRTKPDMSTFVRVCPTGQWRGGSRTDTDKILRIVLSVRLPKSHGLGREGFPARGGSLSRRGFGGTRSPDASPFNTKTKIGNPKIRHGKESSR